MGIWFASRARPILTRIPFPAIALSITLLAFVVRVYHLGAVGLENDEVFSFHAAYSGFSYILQTTTTIEPHPPLYYSFLRLWYELAGVTEFSLRFPSVVAGVLTVGFLFKIGDLLRWRPAGIVAAIILTLAPYHIWYSQDVRMYAPVALFGLVATYFALRVLRQPSRRTLVLYVVFMLLALYTHYYAIFLFIFINLVVFAGLVQVHKARPATVSWAVAQLAVVALYLPWLVLASRISVSYVAGAADVLGTIGESAVFYSVGRSVPADLGLPLALGFLLIGAGGLWHAARTRGAHPSWLSAGFVAGYAFLPLGLGALISLRRPMLASRYFMISEPAFCLVLALGVVGLTRRSRILGITAALFLAAAQLFSLGNYFVDYRYVKTDLPDAIRYVLEHTRAGDAVVLDGWGQPLQFWYYNTVWAKEPAPSYLFPESVPIQAESIPARLDEIMAQHQGVWLLDYGVETYDPQHLVEAYLARNYYQTAFARVGWNRVVYYAAEPARKPNQTPLNVTLGGEARIESLDIETTSARPGEILHLALSWHALKETQKDYTVSWRLVDRDGHVVYQRDARPASGFAPSTQWTAGTEVTDRFGLPVPVSIPPGQYALSVVVYDKASGTVLEPRRNDQPLPGNVIPLAHVDVTDTPLAPLVEDPPPLHRATFAFGGLRLLGYDLPGGPVRPGDPLPVKLYWQAGENVDPLGLAVHLRDDRGQDVVERTTRPGKDWFPDEKWPQGRVVADYVDLTVPSRTTTGTYALSLDLAGADGEGSAFLLSPSIRVVSRDRSFTAPAPVYPRTASFGGFVDLLGYDLVPGPEQAVRAGDSLQLTLYWRAAREMEESYKVFVHLVGDDGQIYGQKDAAPLDGKAPTPGWAQGEVLTDHYAIPIRPDAPPGRYRLEVGLYEPATGTRLSLSDGSGDSCVLTDAIMSR